MQYEKVKLYRHPNGENRGAGASRNLGIQKANFEWIAFLDADDWYLPNRFDDFRKALFDELEFDGIYGASEIFDQGLGQTSQAKQLIADFEPKQLLEVLVTQPYGFHTNTITVKKSKLKEVGLFNENLRLHQDTELWYRLAYHGRLIPGDLSIVIAVIRRHEENRITRFSGKESKRKFNTIVYQHFRDKSISPKVFRVFFNRYLLYTCMSKGRNKVVAFLPSLSVLIFEIIFSRKRLKKYVVGVLSK